MGKKTKTNKGDRIVQIVLLVLIASGLTGIIFTNGKGSGSGMEPGKPPMGRPEFPGETMGGEKGDTAVAVETATVEKDTISQFIRINGDVVADNTVDIYSDTSGKIESQLIEEGDYVKKDEILAMVDPSQPGRNFSNSIVSSTINGTVTSLHFQVGDTITTQTPIATIGDLKDLQIETYIPERFISLVTVGLKAAISFEALNGETFNGSITEISPVVDTKSRSLAVTLELKDYDERIRVGMFSSIKLITKFSEDSIVIPRGALSSYYDENIVYVVSTDNMVERREVETGLLSEEMVEIISGLSVGEEIVLQGQSSLSDGSAVRIVTE